MSEKRLQEIKDSVEFQKEILEAHNMNTLCVDEEQELVEEIERLKQRIDKAIEYIKMYDRNGNDLVFSMKASEDLLDILKGSSDNG